MIVPMLCFTIAGRGGMSGRSGPRGMARFARGLIVFGSLIALVLPAVAQGECPNEQLRQSAGVSNIDPATGQPYDASLPDCRAYEQVSPSDKEGGRGGVYSLNSTSQIYVLPQLPLRSLAAGTEITYPGEPFYHAASKTLEEVEYERITGAAAREQYTSVRSPDGWMTLGGDLLGTEEIPTPILPSVAAGLPLPVVREETPNGSKVFFTDEKDLTPGSTAAVGEPDLYEYTVPSPSLPEGKLVDLTIDLNAGHADVQGILGVGGEGKEEGEYVYFIAAGTLVPGPLVSGGGCITSGGTTNGMDCNLYLRHNGRTTFIATLSDADENTATLGTSLEDWAGPSGRTAQVSPSGRYLAFGSNAPLTKQNAASEIFRYDAEADERHEPSIVCVSCGSSACATCGALPVVSAEAQINGTYRQRYMLNNGRVIFNAAASLESNDINNQSDVYEWEPSGVGDCSTSSDRFSDVSDGCVGLVSGGASEAGFSQFADASADGSDIFFTTAQSLVPQDQDEITDLYDAREDGGFPPPPGPACAFATACPGAVAAPTALGTLTSATLSGVEGPPVGPAKTSKPPTRTEKLAKALKTCHAKKNRKMRVACESAARKAYGVHPHVKKAKRRKQR
jgi:hypothetical protein